MKCNHTHHAARPPWKGAPDKHVVKSAARGQWRKILGAFEFDPYFFTGRHVQCPGCGGKDRFRFTDLGGDGMFICSQGTGVPLIGDGFELIKHITGMPFPIVLRRVGQILGLDGGGVTVVPKPSQLLGQPLNARDTKQETSSAQIERVLSQCKPVTAGGVVAKYLSARGLGDVLADLPQTIHEHPALPYYEDAKKIAEYPAMVSEVHTTDGKLVCLQRTYLSESGDGKAPVSQPKKLTRLAAGSKTTGAAVRLYAADDHVALAEGIESALAVRLIWGWPTWACLCANGLRAIELPSSIEAVRIYADADVPGLLAAHHAVNWLRGEGRCVEWMHSAKEGADPLDVWNATHGEGQPR
jgi:putative DNA primase/helicase